MKTVFVNPERCIGCRQCEYACAVEHSRSRHPIQALFEDPPPRSRIHVEPGPSLNTSFPNRCRHCRPAPCQQTCPTAAIHRDLELDLVLVDASKCIACAMCAMVCPFDALTFQPETRANGVAARLVATKCDGCVDRLHRGEPPACVEVCKVEALVFGELNELVREGRLRETGRALAATAMGSAETGTPETVAGWRAWGERTAELFGGVR